MGQHRPRQVPKDQPQLQGLPQRPQLKPGVRRVWRGAHILQLGHSAEHAVLIDSDDDAVWALLTSLDGQHTLGDLLAVTGLPPHDVAALLAQLTDAGLLDDAALSSRPLAGVSKGRRAQLQPEHDAAVWAASDPGGGARAFQQRRAASVEVRGLGRIGASLALLLHAAGVGTLLLHDDALVTETDVAPGSHRLVDVSRARQDALRDRIPAGRRAASQRPDLVVLADAAHRDHRTVAEILVRADQPHLLVDVIEGVGHVGPLVLPGVSSCIRCSDLHRADRDALWPTVAAQLVDTPRETPSAVMTSAVASLAVSSILQFLGEHSCAVVDGELVVSPPDHLTRRRHLPPHPSCGCAWRGTIAS